MRCVECENRYARKFCLDCDDGYCDSCYRFIHTKGKKSNHKWVEPGHDTPKYDKTIYNPNNNNEKQIDNNNIFENSGYYEQINDIKIDNNNNKVEWTENIDELGRKYWTNDITGESQFSNPNTSRDNNIN